MEQFRDQGDTLVDRLGADRLQSQALSASDAANEGVLRNMAARGQLGGGDELQARMGANAGLQNQAASMAAQLAEQRSGRRMEGAQAAGGMAGQIRAGDIGVQQMNADYVTRLNEITSAQRTEAARSNAAAMTQAQGRNVDTAQRVGDSNALLAYGAARENKDSNNQLRGRAFDERARKAGMLVGATQQYGDALDRKNQQQAQAIQGVGQGIGQAAGGAAGGLFGF